MRERLEARLLWMHEGHREVAARGVFARDLARRDREETSHSSSAPLALTPRVKEDELIRLGELV